MNIYGERGETGVNVCIYMKLITLVSLALN